MNAEQDIFYKKFVAFVESDFAESRFTKAFYNNLNIRFGMIAHYDKGGFYDYYSHTGWGQFIRDCLEYQWANEVELAIKKWLADNNIMLKVATKEYAAFEKAERAELARLKAKYEKEAK